MKAGSIKRFKIIKAHFERAAKVFDKNFFKVAPFYQDAIEALVETLPFSSKKRIRVVDLGCGTGNIAQEVLRRFPHAHVTCVDLAEQMIAIAQAKLSRFKTVAYWNGDIRHFPYQGKYDAVIGSLVLHHVEKKEKTTFYRKMFNALAPGGVFYTADVVFGSNPYLQNLYLERWKRFMRKNLSANQIAATLRKHHREDRPCTLMDELAMLRDAGFKDIDVVWKQHYFCIYGGVKR